MRYPRPLSHLLLLGALLFAALAAPDLGRAARAGVRVLTGSNNGAAYRVEVPAAWNGTLLLFSHGTVTPGSANPGQVATDRRIADYLTGQGYALAGSGFRTTGWSVAVALPDQIALLNRFQTLVGKPQRVIAWGESLGGMITAGLVQRYPHRFSGALSLCGPLAGTVAGANTLRDLVFAFKTLIAPHDNIDVIHFSNGFSDLIAAELDLRAAQGSALGRARIALVAALADLPGWYDGHSPPPDSTVGQENAQFQWLRNAVLPYTFIIGADLEQKAGGNPSWNTGVDYSQLLARSADRAEVRALYPYSNRLTRDLATLARGRRVAADARALTYARRNIVFDGRIAVPVLTIHTIGDGLVPVEHEQAYAAAVKVAGRTALLRQRFVRRTGHCTFTAAETVTALQMIAARVGTGRWPAAMSPDALNRTASSLPAVLQGSSPSFVNFSPDPYLRPFDPSAK